jgi:hypothetical protein
LKELVMKNVMTVRRWLNELFPEGRICGDFCIAKERPREERERTLLCKSPNGVWEEEGSAWTIRGWRENAARLTVHLACDDRAGEMPDVEKSNKSVLRRSLAQPNAK